MLSLPRHSRGPCPHFTSSKHAPCSGQFPLSRVFAIRRIFRCLEVADPAGGIAAASHEPGCFSGSSPAKSPTEDICLKWQRCLALPTRQASLSYPWTKEPILLVHGFSLPFRGVIMYTLSPPCVSTTRPAHVLRPRPFAHHDEWCGTGSSRATEADVRKLPVAAVAPACPWSRLDLGAV